MKHEINFAISVKSQNRRHLCSDFLLDKHRKGQCVITQMGVNERGIYSTKKNNNEVF